MSAARTRNSLSPSKSPAKSTATKGLTGLARVAVTSGVACPLQDQTLTDAELDEAYLANGVLDAHRDDPEFGYRFLADEVRAAGHAKVGDRTIWRICAANGWWCSFDKKKTSRACAGHCSTRRSRPVPVQRR